MNFTLRKRLSLWIILLSFLTPALPAQQMSETIPLDPKVRLGKLDNGIRYYIRQNAKPEKRVELRLVVNTGSMQENENQRGLAHFTEHMLFNGTKNFEKNDIVDYLQTIGVKFGADLNAYTSFDETVYILPIPTDDEEILNQGFQILEDWAHQATFEGEEIDKERGVVLEEMRSRSGAGQRILDQWLPVLLKDSRYAERIPIGKKEILENFEYETIRNFYRDWYRPDLMAVVAVGDINPDEIEAKIKNYFGKIQPVENPREKQSYPVPDHEDTRVVIATDPEEAFNSVRVYYKKDPQEVNTQQDYRRQLIYTIYGGMFNKRLSELSQKADPPFIGAGVGYGGTLARTKDAYTVFATVQEDKIMSGLETVLAENKRVLEHGFTQSELDRYKKDLLNRYEKQYNERDKTPSRRLISEYVNHFLEDEPAPGIEWEYEFVKEVLPGIQLQEINPLASQWITDKNRVVIVTAAEKEGVSIPTEAEIRQALDKMETMEVEPYEDKVIDEPLMANMPVPGRVVDQKTLEAAEATEWVLSNGMKVVLKPTNFKDDEVLISAFSFGGHSLVSDEDYFSANNAAAIVNQSGIRDFSNTDLQKLLTGKTVNVSPYINDYTEGFNGSASPKDLETMFQLVHLYFTQPRKDQDAFQSYINKNKAIYQNLMSNPQFYFFNRYSGVLSQNHPRKGGFPQPEDLEKVDLDKAYQIYQERFAEAGDFVFFLVGSFEMETIKPMIETYLASLPTKNREESFRDLGIRPPEGVVEEKFQRGTDEKTQVAIVFNGELKDQKDEYYLNSLADVLKIKLTENLREEKGGVYGTSARAGVSKYPVERYTISVQFTCAPENANELKEAVYEEIKKVQENGPTKKDLDKIKESQRRDLEERRKENRYWVSGLNEVYYEGKDVESLSEKKILKRISDLTVNDLQKTAQTYCDFEQRIVVQMNPEEKPEEPMKSSEAGVETGQMTPDDTDVEEVLNRYLEAVGGKEKLEQITSIYMLGTMSVMGQEMKSESWKKAPFKSLKVQTVAGNEMARVAFDGENALIKTMQGEQKIEGDKAKTMQFDAAVFLELDYQELGLEPSLEGIEKVGEADAYKVVFPISGEVTLTRWYDTESGLLVKEKSLAGETTYDEYQEVEGIKLPLKTTSKIQGFDAKTEFTEVKINPELEDELFQVE